MVRLSLAALVLAATTASAQQHPAKAHADTTHKAPKAAHDTAHHAGAKDAHHGAKADSSKHHAAPKAAKPAH